MGSLATKVNDCNKVVPIEELFTQTIVFCCVVHDSANVMIISDVVEVEVPLFWSNKRSDIGHVAVIILRVSKEF